jgi:hypothetical protein
MHVKSRAIVIVLATVGILTACGAEPELSAPLTSPSTAAAEPTVEDDESSLEPSAPATPTVATATVYALPLETSTGYKATLVMQDDWVPGIRLGDPDYFKLAGAPEDPTLTYRPGDHPDIDVTWLNQTEGGRDIALAPSSTFQVTKYWDLPDAIAEQVCAELGDPCSEEDVFLLGTSTVGINYDLHPDGILAGNSETTAYVPASLGAIADLTNRSNFESERQFPERIQGDVEAVLEGPADFLGVRIRASDMPGGITEGGSCIIETPDGYTFVEAVFDPSNGELLSETDARKTGLACASGE